MMDEKQKKKKNEKKTKGVPTFLILLLQTVCVAIVGFIVLFICIFLFEKSRGSFDIIAFLLGIINFVMLFILMIFFYFSLRGLKTLKKATEAAERGEIIGSTGNDGDISELINVVGRVASRMSINSKRQAKISDDYQAFVPRGILEYCHVDIHDDIKPGIIGTIKGTRAQILLGNYKAGTDPEQYANLIERITGMGGLMLSCTSENIGAIFPGRKEEEVKLLGEELKETQIMNLRYDTFDIVVLGSSTCMFVRAKEHTY